MDKMKKAGLALYKVYVGIGMLAIAIITVCVIATVIMRYFFNISFIFLEEFVTVLFAFSTFWGIGMCTLEDEHVAINVLFDLFPAKVQHALKLFNYTLMTVVNLLMTYLAIGWIEKAGKTLTNAMRIQLKYIYVFLPIGFIIGAVCCCIKLYLIFTGKEKDVQFKPEIDEDDVIAQMERELSGS